MTVAAIVLIVLGFISQAVGTGFVFRDLAQDRLVAKALKEPAPPPSNIQAALWQIDNPLGADVIQVRADHDKAVALLSQHFAGGIPNRTVAARLILAGLVVGTAGAILSIVA